MLMGLERYVREGRPVGSEQFEQLAAVVGL